MKEEEEVTPVESMLALVVSHQSLSNLHLVCLYLVLHYLLKQKQNNNMTGKT